MINKVILVGNLGADPVVRYTPTGKQVTSFSIATTEKWKDAAGELQESTEWHRIIAWGRLAEICAEYLGTGSRVYVEGKIQTRKWEDSDGITRYTTEIVCREMKMLSSRGVQGGGAGESGPPMSEEPPFPDGSGDDVPF